MKAGHHQVDIEDKHKYERLMEDCLGDINSQICVKYLYDLINFS